MLSTWCGQHERKARKEKKTINIHNYKPPQKETQDENRRITRQEKANIKKSNAKTVRRKKPMRSPMPQNSSEQQANNNEAK